MLCFFDVPFDGPQWLAWSVDAAALARLRTGMRRVVERGEVRVLDALWDDLVGAFRRDARGARWRVPVATLADLAALLREARSLDEVDAPELDGCIAMLRGLVGDHARVDVNPKVWLSVPVLWASLDRYFRNDGHDDATRVDALRFMACMQLRGVGELHALSSPLDLDDGTWSWLDPVHGQGLDWVRGVRFREGGRELDADEVQNFMTAEAFSSEALPADTPHSLRIVVHNRARVGDILRLMVGPFMRTQGPGPFVPMLEVAQPLEDPEWERLPLFRIPGAGGLSWRHPDAAFLEGDALLAAADEVLAWCPPFRWWKDEEDRSIYSHRGHQSRGWQTLEGCEEYWPASRDRFVALCRRAHSAGRAVLLHRELPGDQGPGWGALTARWGEKVEAPTAR